MNELLEATALAPIGRNWHTVETPKLPRWNPISEPRTITQEERSFVWTHDQIAIQWNLERETRKDPIPFRLRPVFAEDVARFVGMGGETPATLAGRQVGEVAR